MEKIKKLTKEQEEMIPVWKEKWLKISFSTERADRSMAEKAFKEMYALTKYKEPKIYWLNSPFAVQVAANTYNAVLEFFKKEKVDFEKMREGVSDGVRAGVRAGVSDGVSDGVRAGVAAGVYAGVDDGVSDGVKTR